MTHNITEALTIPKAHHSMSVTLKTILGGSAGKVFAYAISWKGKCAPRSWMRYSPEDGRASRTESYWILQTGGGAEGVQKRALHTHFLAPGIREE